MEILYINNHNNNKPRSYFYVSKSIDFMSTDFNHFLSLSYDITSSFFIFLVSLLAFPLLAIPYSYILQFSVYFDFSNNSPLSGI